MYFALLIAHYAPFLEFWEISSYIYLLLLMPDIVYEHEIAYAAIKSGHTAAEQVIAVSKLELAASFSGVKRENVLLIPMRLPIHRAFCVVDEALGHFGGTFGTQHMSGSFHFYLPFAYIIHWQTKKQDNNSRIS